MLFSAGMIKAKSRRQALAVVLAGSIGAMALALRPAQAQGNLVTAVQAVLNVINGLIRTGLASIRIARNSILRLYQVSVWPQQMINQAHGLATQMITQCLNPMANIFQLNLASATLPPTQDLEQVARDGQTTDFSTLTANYTSVYGAVPGTSSASPYDQNMTDIDDALAQDTLKTLKESEAADTLSLSVANQIENAASQTAPGSAPFLTATALVGAIQSEAVMQKMIAAELRQEAGLLAHRTALDKEGATSASRLASAIENLLQ
jgi:hypothetical protein